MGRQQSEDWLTIRFMRTVGSAKTRFRVSEFDPDMTDWGHTAYVTVETQERLALDDKTELVIFFTPRKGTTFEEVEKLVQQLNAVLDTVHFNLRYRLPCRVPRGDSVTTRRRVRVEQCNYLPSANRGRVKFFV